MNIGDGARAEDKMQSSSDNPFIAEIEFCADRFSIPKSPSLWKGRESANARTADDCMWRHPGLESCDVQECQPHKEAL